MQNVQQVIDDMTRLKSHFVASIATKPTDRQIVEANAAKQAAYKVIHTARRLIEWNPPKQPATSSASTPTPSRKKKSGGSATKKIKRGSSLRKTKKSQR